MNGFADRTPTALYVDGQAFETRIHEDGLTVEVRRNAASMLQAETEILASKRDLADVCKKIDAYELNVAEAKKLNRAPNPLTKLLPSLKQEKEHLHAQIKKLEAEAVPVTDVYEFPLAWFKSAGPSLG